WLTAGNRSSEPPPDPHAWLRIRAVPPAERRPRKARMAADLRPHPAHLVAEVDVVEDVPPPGTDVVGEQREVGHRAVVVVGDVSVPSATCARADRSHPTAARARRCDEALRTFQDVR